MTVVDNVHCEKCGETNTMGLHDIHDYGTYTRWKLVCSKCGHVQSGEYAPGSNTPA